MSTTYRFTVLLVVAVAILVASAFHLANAQVAKERVGQKWEYCLAYDCTEKEFSRLGEEGWELVALKLGKPGAPQDTFYFKRSK